MKEYNNEYIEFMNDPNNSHNCTKCPENAGFDAWPGNKLARVNSIVGSICTAVMRRRKNNMRWQEIHDILMNYEKETRKGWYSYTWSNGFVSIAQRCEPERVYTLNTRDNRVFIDVPKASGEEPDVYYWHTVSTEYAANDVLIDADDYFITSTVSHPYIAMLHIKEDEIKTQPPVIFKDFKYHSDSEINERKINLRALNNIKAFIYEQDRYCYNKRWSWPIPEAKLTTYIAND